MNHREFILAKIILVLVPLIQPRAFSPASIGNNDEFSRVDFGPISRSDYDLNENGDDSPGSEFGFSDDSDGAFPSYGSPAASVSDYYGDDEEKGGGGLQPYESIAPNIYDYGGEGNDGIGSQDRGQYQDNLPHPGVGGQAYPNYEDDYLNVGGHSPSDPFDF